MSTEAIQQVVQESETLPESDQRLVLGFLTTIRERRHAARTGHDLPRANSALVEKSGLLVFTGEVDASAADWVQRERGERDHEVLERAMTPNTGA